MSAERRKHDRFKVDIECTVAIEEVALEGPGRIEEMSVGGCFVATEAIAPFGQRLRLDFALDQPPRDLSIEGIVRWTSPRGMGVQFLALGVVAVYALTEHLAEKPPASLPPPRPSPGKREDLLARWRAARRRDRTFAKAALALAEAGKEGGAAPPPAGAEPVDDDLAWDLEAPPSEGGLLRARVDALEAERDEALRERDELRALLAAREEQLEQAQRMLAERARQVEALRAELAQAPPREDDLTAIHGIGPKFAEALRALGVTRFADVAAWSPDDVATYAERLGTSARRIERDGWVASAAALAEGAGD